MTRPWDEKPQWQGQTVAVLGTGPSLTPEVLEVLAGCPLIAVNEACRVVPHADMLVALDGNWPQEMREFAGIRLTGIEDDTLDAFYVGHRFMSVTIGVGHIVEIRNSGLEAIRIAAQLGAARVLLVGFDAAFGGPQTHFYDDEVDTGEYVGLVAGLKQITAELAARGIVVERFPPAEIAGEPKPLAAGEVIDPPSVQVAQEKQTYSRSRRRSA